MSGIQCLLGTPENGLSGMSRRYYSWSLPNSPEEKCSSGKYYWITSLTCKIHSLYSLNEKFKKIGIG